MGWAFFVMEKIAPAVKTPDIIEPSAPVYRREGEKAEIGPMPLVETKTDGMPIESFEKEEQSPYLLKCFEIEAPYTYLALEDWERARIDDIDSFVKGEIESTYKKPTLGSYKKVLDGLKKKLGIDKDTKTDNALERLCGFARAFKAVSEKQENRRRREILKKMVKIAKDKDFDAEDLELLLIEEYSKEAGDWE